MMNLVDFFYMEGKGIYVWPSYSIALIVLAWNIVLPLLKRKKLEQTIQNRIKQRLKTSSPKVSQEIK